MIYNYFVNKKDANIKSNLSKKIIYTIYNLKALNNIFIILNKMKIYLKFTNVRKN